ncbi:molybdenum cofactor guanylyltransferase [Sphingopyxis sp.]|uniref:molybdenum cofactor guanylyltransferase n=1 Tax=Sphingopyxis sp. TaxID=1908224 RepID=UPI003BACD5C4
MTDAAKRIAGVVLAGGRSARFGSDKADALYRGRTLIDWSIAALEPHCEAIFVSGRDHPALTGVADRPKSGLGPLGGLAGAMQAAEASGFTHILSLPCDTPEVPSSLLERLVLVDGAYVTSCPVIGIWPTRLGESLEAWLAGDHPRAVRAWAEAHDFAAIDAEPILNINQVVDLP